MSFWTSSTTIERVLDLQIVVREVQKLPVWLATEDRRKQIDQLASLDVPHNFLKIISYCTDFPMIYFGNSDRNLGMGKNLQNCSVCPTSWLTHGSNLEHVEDATCHNPFDLHGKAVADVEICENE